MINPDKPMLPDLFCGAGGAAVGYHRAGFGIVGVDINPQPNYPFAFVQADALEYLKKYGGVFHAIHASPPCQHYSAMSQCRPGLAQKYPALIEPVREILDPLGRPYVIENVIGSPLKKPGHAVRPDVRT